MRKLGRYLALAALVLAAVPPAASAHKESDSYLHLAPDPANAQVLKGQWDIALRDLDFAIGIDSNRDGAITWGEVKEHRTGIENYALARLAIKGDGLVCNLTPTQQLIDEHTDGAYDVILFDATCDKEIPNRLTIDYQLFADIDPYHRGIVTIAVNGQSIGAVLGPKEPSAALDLRQPDRWRQFRSFVVDGMWHIWTGPDHLLFVLSLLLPAVLWRRRQAGGARTLWSAGRWEPAAGLAPALWELVKVISAFTLSHSVTLSLSVLGIVHLPSRLVECGIALSVIVAALNNVVPVVTRRAWLVAFAFGFIHGLGFASALSGLQLPPGAMLASLGGFNVGVEIGQESVVLPLIPLAYLVRRTQFYRVRILRGGSLAIAAVATIWLGERAFDVIVPGFAFLTPA
jgi:hypothetical protein